MAAKRHILKIVEPYFSDVQAGVKRFEVRKNDCDYKVGDICEFHEYSDDESHGMWVWKSLHEKGLTFKITYILEGGKFGVEKGYVVLGLEPIEE